MNIDFRDMAPHQWVAPLLIIVIAATIAWAIFRTDVLRDQGDAVRKPYSFSRMQFVWWLTIIASCYVGYYGFAGKLQVLNATALALLGIGAGTTAIAKVVDTRQDAENAHRIQDQPSEDFLRDILSDDSGVSVHRLQAFVFTLIYGVVFVTDFLADRAHQFPSFDTKELALLGGSASMYLYMKTGENAIAVSPNQEASASGIAPDRDAVVG